MGPDRPGTQLWDHTMIMEWRVIVTYDYEDEVVNGLVVTSRVYRNGLSNYSYVVAWEGGAETGCGYPDLVGAEAGMADAFRRTMENGRIGGKPVKFGGFPVQATDGGEAHAG